MSHHTHRIPPAKFLRFKKYHIAPLTEISGDALKESAWAARTELRDHEKIGHTTALNHIVQALGFSGGFGRFVHEGEPRLREFMERHGLRERRELIRPNPDMALVNLEPRQLADRLAQLGSNLPRRVFTGHDVDWFGVNNRWFRWNPWNDGREVLRDGLSFDDVTRGVDAAERAEAGQGVVLLEAAVAANDFFVRAAANSLLGGVLLDYPGKPWDDGEVAALVYRPPDCPIEAFERHTQRTIEAGRIFRKWIDNLSAGWVDVLRFNERLVLLRGPAGAYDFVFPQLRDTAFDHNPFEPYLKNADVPKSHDTYHFRRWLYFEYAGWLEQDRHQAEERHYADGGDRDSLPNEEELLKRHLTALGIYRAPRKAAPRREGFQTLEIGGQRLNVSNLITIAQFAVFLADNPEYARYSRANPDVDRWEPVNSDADKSLPTAVTWYDANAYAAWISKKQNLPVRLLTEAEYLAMVKHEIGLLPESPAGGGEPKPLLRSCWPEGGGDFQSKRIEFDPAAMEWKSGQSGLRFLISEDFGEWLNEEAAAVNTLTRASLCSVHYPPVRGKFSARSTGKYKSKKIGFRLCYLDGELPSVKRG